MTAITLPKDLEAWAEAEVAAGRAKSVDVLAAKAVAGYRRQLTQFRESLDAAEAEADAGDVHFAEKVFAELRASLDEASADVKAGNGIPLEDVMAEFERLYPDEA